VSELTKLTKKEERLARRLLTYQRLLRRQRSGARFERSVVRVAEATLPGLSAAKKGERALIAELTRRRSGAHAGLVVRGGAVQWCEMQVEATVRALGFTKGAS